MAQPLRPKLQRRTSGFFTAIPFTRWNQRALVLTLVCIAGLLLLLNTNSLLSSQAVKQQSIHHTGDFSLRKERYDIAKGSAELGGTTEPLGGIRNSVTRAPESILVTGWGLGTATAVGQVLSGVKLGMSKLTYKNTLGYKLAAEVMVNAQSLHYQLEDVDEDLRARVSKLVGPIVEMMARKPSRDNNSSLVVIPEALFFLPFFQHAAQRQNLTLAYLIVVQDGLDAIIAHDMEQMIGQIGPLFASETVIDRLCLARIRPWSWSSSFSHQQQNYFLQGETWQSTPPEYDELIRFPATTGSVWALGIRSEMVLSERKSKVRACSVQDDTALRAAMLWSVVHQVLFKVEYLSSIALEDISTLRIEDVVDRNDAFHETLRMLVPQHDDEYIREAVSRWGSSKSRVRKALPSFPGWRTAKQVDQVLLVQAAILLDERVQRALGYKALGANEYDSQASALFPSSGAAEENDLMVAALWPEIRDAPAVLPEPIVDAGYCEKKLSKVSPEGRKHLTLSVGVCLPSFIVLGAQKGGTDELAVWLNRNPYTRRLDGAVEVHYFDCLGRASGWDRKSCSRIRSSLMTSDSRAAKSNITSIKSNMFQWSEHREQSRYLTSWWREYLELGNLNYHGYVINKAQTFEKTPAYMDFANPFDMMRFLPSVRLLFLMRNPVDRFISSYFMICSGYYHDTTKECTYEELERHFDNFSGLDFDDPKQRSLEDTQSGSVAYRVKRGLVHSMYTLWLDTWRTAFPDRQIMVVFSEHFRVDPKATIYAIELFNGLNASRQHYDYSPQRTNSGLWTLGKDYSKANRPTHKSKPPARFYEKLVAFFRPWNKRLREQLESSDVFMGHESMLPKSLKFDFPPPSWLTGVATTAPETTSTTASEAGPLHEPER